MTNNLPTSRGVKGYGWGALAGIASAAILALALSFAGSPLILFVYLASIPLFLAGLGAGVSAVSVASLIGTLALLAFAPLSDAMSFLVLYAIPSVGLTRMALSFRTSPDGKTTWASEGKILTALATYPCVIFLCIYAAMSNTHGGLLSVTLDAFNGMSDQIAHYLMNNGQTVTPETTMALHQYFETCARMAPALVMCAWLFVNLVSIIIAQGFLQQRKVNLGPSFSLAQLHVPTWVVFAAAISASVACFAPMPYSYLGLNLALLLGVPFFFVGLAVVHAWAAQTRSPTAILVIFYVVISIIVYLVLLVAMLGAIDQWVDFRKYFAGKILTKPKGE